MPIAPLPAGRYVRSGLGAVARPGDRLGKFILVGAVLDTIHQARGPMGDGHMSVVGRCCFVLLAGLMLPLQAAAQDARPRRLVDPLVPSPPHERMTVTEDYRHRRVR